MSPYKFNLRLKSYITCAGRIKIAETILSAGIDNVFRCHTDGIILYKPIEFSDPNIWIEEKTTGNIHFLHNNNYKNINDKSYEKWLIKNNIEIDE